MDVFSPSDKTYLPQTVISVKALNGLNYQETASSTPIVVFVLPATLGFINSEDTVLNFEFEYKTSGEVQNVRPQSNFGLAGMIRQIDIHSAQTGTLLESILDYDVLQGVLYSHNSGFDQYVQDGTYNIKAQTECYCQDDDEFTPFVDPSVIPSQTNQGTVTGATDATAHTFQKQKICLPIRLSSLIGEGGRNNTGICPISALGGLSIRFLLHPTAHFSVLHKNDIMEDTKLADFFFATNAPDDPDSILIKIIQGFNDTIASPDGTASSYVRIPPDLYSPNTLSAAYAAAYTQAGFTITGTVTTFTNWVITNGTGADFTVGNNANFYSNFCKLPAAAIPSAGTTTAPLCSQPTDTTNALGNKPFTNIPLQWKSPLNCNPFNINTQPFLAKTSVQAFTSNLATNKFVPFGSVIDSIQAETLTDSFNIKATYATTGAAGFPNPIDTDEIYLHQQTHNIFLTLTSAFNPQTALDLNAQLVGGNTIKTVVNNDVTYALTNMSMDVTAISPPPSYISSMMGAIQKSGLDFPINTFEIIRTNVLKGEAIVQMNLPFVNTRARSVISTPQKGGTKSLSVFTHCDLLRPLHLTKYFYTYGGQRHPSLGVDTSRVSNGLDSTPYKPSLSQELIQAQKGAFEYSLDKVRSLNAYNDGYKFKSFFLGRNLGTLNSHYNVQDADLSLTLEATGTTSPIDTTLTFNNYLYSENIIKITPSGVELFR